MLIIIADSQNNACLDIFRTLSYWAFFFQQTSRKISLALGVLRFNMDSDRPGLELNVSNDSAQVPCMITSFIFIVTTIGNDWIEKALITILWRQIFKQQIITLL